MEIQRWNLQSLLFSRSTTSSASVNALKFTAGSTAGARRLLLGLLSVQLFLKNCFDLPERLSDALILQEKLAEVVFLILQT